MSIRRIFFAVLLAALSRSVSAQANPALEGYSNHAAFSERIRQLDTSELVAVTSLGKSFGGRDVWLLTVGSGEAKEKPAIAVVGNVHGPHLAGGEIALRIAEQLVKQAGESEQIKKLLAERTFFFIPRPNPDGCEKAFSRPYREQAGNDRKTDDDRDFETGEDPPDDLNGDGFITMMRVEDDAGKHLPHPDDPRVLIEVDAKKNERGKFRLLVEGRDDDGDETFNEDGGDGVSLNRNFPFGYKPFTAAAGANAVSEPESRALADFLHDRPSIAVVFSFSLEDNLFHSWKPNQQNEGNRIKTSVQSADAVSLDYIAAEYRKVHGGSDAPESSDAAGSFSHWAYYHYGRWSLSARGWWIPKTADKPVEAKVADEKPVDPKADDAKTEEKAEAKKPSGEKRGSDDLNRLHWFKQQGIDGFVDWKPIEHPDFPGRMVEIGGFKPFYTLNPPAKELDGLATKHLQFLTSLPAWLPELTITDSKAESLGGGVYRISATVINRGYLSTMPEMGRVNGEAYPLQVSLALPKDTIYLQGHSRTRLPRLAGAGGNVERTWLVRFPGEKPASLEIKAFAPAVGSVSTVLELK